ncbi:GGDEF domain-containing protein [Acinetobacter sp. S40]|uniref:sensor domain-containing diguanylate cyclase n=1 Tax=Acinetobacter sp. S40 TaxID=2767434 RepID=UPI001909E598|nr:sensor domain-containing diguanylate cyclase [Acinetobacter sp. S40]MBJ9985541.1 GGDEF domain-containing protein [Acinetobacter sp. S40]
MIFKKLIHSLQLNLRKLILFLAIFSVLSLFIISLLVNYYIQKNQLINNSLSVNMEYASKIARGTNSHFKIMLKELDYSAKQLEQSFGNEKALQAEVDRLKFQSDYFNSVIIADQHGNIRSFAPEQLKLNKQVVNHTLGFEMSLKNQTTIVTPPYYSIKKNLVIFLSQPIFDQNRHYLGFIGAAIYLKKDNILNELLTMKYGYKNSYMYVIDGNQHIIFHPDEKRIGTLVSPNTGLTTMMKQKNGKIRLTNSQGEDNLAGFAHIPTTNWIVVSQQPTHELLAQASSIIVKIIAGMLFFYLFIFFIVWRISYLISDPLAQLAKMASHLNASTTEHKIKEIDPWYYEVLRFKLSLLLSSQQFKQKISELNFYVNTDPLTGFYNRRGMELFLDEFIKSETHFFVISLDIDHFKKVNDVYGHENGDQVLKIIAEKIKGFSRDIDACCRIGGEEFIILAPNSDSSIGVMVAERIREAIANTVIPDIGKVTVSVGLAHWPNSARDIKRVFKLADEKLYEAKAEGRNRVKS